MPSSFRPLPLLCLAWCLFSTLTPAAQDSLPANSVALLQPLGLVFDAAGTLFIADSAANLIRAVDSSGNITTVAGTGIQGFSGDNGAATSASLDGPHAIALDTAGNLLLADTHNHRIRRVDAVTHQITTIAGVGTEGFSGDSGPATDARLASPTAITLDTANHLYLADTGNQRIRQVDLTTGIITTLAGTGTQGFSGDGGLATLATFNNISGLALDPSGALYLADTGNHRIRRIDPFTQKVSTVVNDAVTLRRPVGLAFAPSGLLIADASSNRILRLDSATNLLVSVAGQGTQAFAGDEASAAAAMLDSPAALALSPSGLITIADTGNHRVRQISASGLISTIAGLGTLLPGTLTLSGPITQSYGSTILTAALLSTAAPAAKLSLLDTTLGADTLLAQATTAGGAATFDLSTLPAGTHSLLATYSGDSRHRAAQSQTITLTVTPRALTETVTPLSFVFGQAIPAFSARLDGILPIDSSSVTATLTTSATSASPPGSYAIQTALSGPAAVNYVLNPTAAALTITKAPTSLAISHGSGLITAQVSSTTSGQPGGAVTLLTSAGTQLSTVLLNTSAIAALSDATLANGTYTVTAIYSGDADFLPAQSPPLTLTIGPPLTPADFTLSPTGNSTAQTVSAGETAQFSLGFQTVGSTSLAGPVALSVSGLPATMTANFDPPVIPPGGAVNAVTLTIVTPRTFVAALSPHPFGIILVFTFFAPLWIGRRTRRRILFSGLTCVALSGCGARINSTAAQAASKTYAFTITGTTTRLDGTILQHTAAVNLTVLP